MNTPVRESSTTAVLSLVFGVLSWIVIPWIGALGAIICGHMARGEIRRQPDRYSGDGLAVAGLVLGYLQILLSILAVVMIVLFFGGLAAFLAAAGVASH